KTPSIKKFAASSGIIPNGFKNKFNRALFDSLQDSTWNFVVDIIAQSAQQLGNRFIAQAEKRAWLHLAIDKENGKIIDRRIGHITNEAETVLKK
ncbi:MAG: hypothetical protein AAF984_07420, partial [Verrucomicrobiota bacterium]